MFRNARVATIALGILLVPSCSRPEPTGRVPVNPTPDSGTFDRSQLLAAFGACALETYRTFDAATAKLATAVTAQKTTPGEASTTAARQAWSDASDVWHQAEIMGFGPLAASTASGGQSMRDNLYAWPLFGRCASDRIVAAKGYEAPDFLATVLANTRGLAAIEYLTFHAGPENGCSPTDTMNTDGSWAALVAGDLALRRASFAEVLSVDLHTRSTALVDAWAPAKGNFLASFATAGKGSAVYTTEQGALNAVSDGLFFLDLVTKDRKVGAPLGVDEIACASPPCLELVESPFAKHSKQHVRNNVVGFRKIFEGCGADFQGLGFDDLLVAIGAGSVATEMKADIVNALAVIDAYPYASLEEGLATDPAAVRKIYDALKAITDTLKTEFVSVLAFEIPKTAAGDND